MCAYIKGMKNITLSMDEDLLAKGRQYAKDHNLTLNSLVRLLLQRTVESESKSWTEECFEKMDSAGGRSRGRTWSREDLYDV